MRTACAFQVAVDGAAMDAQAHRGTRHVAIRCDERLRDLVLRDLGERETRRGARCTLHGGFRSDRRLRGREGMGAGDPKLFGAIGLWVGWQMLPAILLIGSMIGLGVVLSARLRGAAVTADTALPFGALLAIAAYPAWLFMITTAP